MVLTPHGSLNRRITERSIPFCGRFWIGPGLHKSTSKGGAEVIDRGHDQIEGEKQREQAVLEEETDGDLDLLAQAAGPAIPQDDRLPDVHLPPVESVGRKIRKDLGEDAVEKDLQPGGAGRLQRLDRLGLDVLDDLPEQPSPDPPPANT